jgi:hypothetical protein
MSEQTKTLEWLRHLPEAGTIASMADKEAEALERIAGLREQIAAVEERLAALRADAERQAMRGWADAEIAAAKAVSP